ncbi:MAG: hypothetical protein QOJ92_784 [Frankiales bacterium]|nr:hypothetical protein [Frankiales bacterium]MDX6273574.1 hypothetical protein [Frankiales bacterium]
MSETRFEDVPAAEGDAVVDPHFAELRSTQLLPTSYMPPTMAGHRTPTMRLVSLILVGIFGLATVLGICLTYGPGY